MAVLHVPNPRKVRPGASRLMVAMLFAVTGAIRVPVIETPVPILMVRVYWAARAGVAKQSLHIIYVPVIQAWE